MAVLSADGKYVTVEKGDTLWGIAEKHLGSGSKFKQLAAINNIPNADLIYVGQKIYLDQYDEAYVKPDSSLLRATITQFGLQADVDDTLLLSWRFDKTPSAKGYQVRWEYYTRDKRWFVGNDSETPYKYSTYAIPANATQVRVKVTPISEKYKSDGVERAYWTATATDWKKHSVVRLPATPSAPNVTLDGLELTAELTNITSDADIIFFEVTKNDTTVAHTAKAKIVTSSASHKWTVSAGGRYKVRCYAIKDDTIKSEWSPYSGNYETVPTNPPKLTKCEVTSDDAIYLEWPTSENTTSYDIEYTTDKANFDSSSDTTTISDITETKRKITGIASGKEYYFRYRAVNKNASSEVKYSGWSEVSSITIGDGPAQPTTWSSTTTAINTEPLTLHWVHNSKDGSKQSFADIKITVGGTTKTIRVENSESDDPEDIITSYSVPMVSSNGTPYYAEGAKLYWQVRTAGITKQPGEWSVERVVDIYAQPTLDPFSVSDVSGNVFETLTSFPIRVNALAKPVTQTPIGYHLTITADSGYETIDNLGNHKVVTDGEVIYSKYFDISTGLNTTISAGDVSFENGYSYTLTCVVSMDSGLTAEASTSFTVSWIDAEYVPNAEIGINLDTYSASIRPYCSSYSHAIHKVSVAGTVGTILPDTVNYIYGDPVDGVFTTTGEQVFYGTTGAGESVYYCTVETETLASDVLMSVYRREFDGSFTEIESNIEGGKNTTVTDPHPALDFARYRIVAVDKTTGMLTYYDIPEQPVGGKAAIIQWDEKWVTVDAASYTDELAEPSWTGSMLKLPYNVDVSNAHSPDVELVEYIGRRHPVSYYGTHVGETATWTVAIERSDSETLYALRRLAAYMGNVYVREPSGSGYWANVSVSFSQTHCEMTIPVTIEIARVEGGK